MRDRDSDERASLGAAPKEEIIPEELRDVLEDPGYSGDGRKAGLREALTDLERGDRRPSADRERLVREIKDAIDDEQHGAALADDGRRNKA